MCRDFLETDNLMFHFSEAFQLVPSSFPKCFTKQSNVIVCVGCNKTRTKCIVTIG